MLKKTLLVTLVAVAGFIAQTTAMAADKMPKASDVVRYRVSLLPVSGPATESAYPPLKVQAVVASLVGKPVHLGSTSNTPYVSSCTQTDLAPLAPTLEATLTDTGATAEKEAIGEADESAADETAETVAAGDTSPSVSEPPETETVPVVRALPGCRMANFQMGYRLTLTPTGLDRKGAVRTSVRLVATEPVGLPRFTLSGMSISAPSTRSIELAPPEFAVPKKGHISYDFVFGDSNYRLVLTALAQST